MFSIFPSFFFILEDLEENLFPCFSNFWRPPTYNSLWEFLPTFKVQNCICLIALLCLPLVLAGQYSQMNNLFILTLEILSLLKMLICHLRGRIHSSLWIMMCTLLRSWRQGQACSFRYSLKILSWGPFLTTLVHPLSPRCTLHCFPASFFSITNSFLFLSFVHKSVKGHYSAEAPISRSMCIWKLAQETQGTHLVSVNFQSKG